MKIFSSYNQEFVSFLKSIGGRWDPEMKCWSVPDEYREAIVEKARELNVQNLRVEEEPERLGRRILEEIQVEENAVRREGEAPREGTIRMRMSRDGRFVLISINLLAFTEDIKEMLDGKRRSVRFRVLPPRTK